MRQLIRATLIPVQSLQSVTMSVVELETSQQPDKGVHHPAVAVQNIPGLSSRTSNPLDFLGLYGTSNEACHRRDIPALHITGDANEEQILAAGKVILIIH